MRGFTGNDQDVFCTSAISVRTSCPEQLLNSEMVWGNSVLKSGKWFPSQVLSSLGLTEHVYRYFWMQSKLGSAMQICHEEV